MGEHVGLDGGGGGAPDRGAAERCEGRNGRCTVPAAQVQSDGQVGGCKEEQVRAAAARRHAGECEARVAVQQREERVEEAQLLVRVRLRV